MRLSKAAIVLYVGLVFLSGAVLGAFSHQLYTVSSVNAKSKRLSPEEFRKGVVSDMRTRLKLSDEQVTKLNLILDDTRARMREVHDKSQPEILQIRHEQTDKIKGMLSSEQQAEYDQMRKERDERSRQKGGRPGGPGF